MTVPPRGKPARDANTEERPGSAPAPSGEPPGKGSDADNDEPDPDDGWEPV